MSEQLQRLRAYLTLPTLLLGLALILAGGGVYFYQQRDQAREEKAGLEDDLAAARSGVDSVEQQNFSLTEELKQLEALPPPQVFPSRNEVLGLGTAVATYVSERGIRLSTFDTSQRIVDLEGAQYPAVTYTMVADGPAVLLSGILSLVGAVPTSVVDDLEFRRDPESEDHWFASLDISIFYQADPGGEQ